MTFQPKFKRPGLAIKNYLMRHNEATIGAIRGEYVGKIKAFNKERRRGHKKPLRVPSWHSFYNYFKVCSLLGWVELVGYGAAEGYRGHPDRVVFVDRTQSPAKVTTGAKTGVWRLTAKGAAEEEGWLHPWRETLGMPEEPAPFPVVPKRSNKPMIQREPEEAPKVAGPDYAAIVEELKGILDEDKKAASIKKLWNRMNKYNLSEETVVGFDDVESAINEYQDIEKSGMTPEEYRDEKSDAFETLVDAVEALEPAEEE